METIRSSEQVGGIARRFREDLGLSRASLAARAGVSARTVYAFEAGEGGNIGLGKTLAILRELGLSVRVGPATEAGEPAVPTQPMPEWPALDERWALPATDGDSRG